VRADLRHAGIDAGNESTGYPIEIKLTTKPTKGDTRSISALRSTYPNQDIAPGLVICLCERGQRLNPIDCTLPWDSR
jgi:hypothetical protein